MAAEQEFDPEPILRALNDHGVDYIVVGGLAAAAHGVVRATADLDVVVDRSWDNAGRLAAALAELGAEDVTGAGTPLTVEVLVRRADRKLSTPHGALHVLHEVGGVPAFRQFGSPELIRLGDQTVPVANLADLRYMKRSADRPKDRVDLAELEDLHGPEEPGAA
jgi:hypothetical protein